jgi:hypothetical protein
VTDQYHRNADNCPCDRQPACFGHEPIEWGGGEPDICAPHDHLEGAELEAALQIAAVLDQMPDDHSREKTVRFFKWKLDEEAAS